MAVATVENSFRQECQDIQSREEFNLFADNRCKSVSTGKSGAGMWQKNKG